MYAHQSYSYQDQLPQPYTAFKDNSLVKKFLQAMPYYHKERFFKHPAFIRVVKSDGTVIKFVLGPKGWQIVISYMDSNFAID